MTTTEIIDFINRETVPSAQDWPCVYSHISKIPELMEMRREYRANLRRLEKEQTNLFE